MEMDLLNRCISSTKESFAAWIECGKVEQKETFVLLLLSRISLINEERKRFLQFSREEKGRQELKGVIRNAGLKWNKSILGGEKRFILNRECQNEISKFKLSPKEIVSCISKMTDVVIYSLSDSVDVEQLKIIVLLMLEPEFFEECEIVSDKDNFEVLKEVLLFAYKKLNGMRTKFANEAGAAAINCSDLMCIIHEDKSLSTSEIISLSASLLEQNKQIKILSVQRKNVAIEFLRDWIRKLHGLAMK